MLEPLKKVDELRERYNQSVLSGRGDGYYLVYTKGINYFESTHDRLILLLWVYSTVALGKGIEAESYLSRFVESLELGSDDFIFVNELLVFSLTCQGKIDEAYQLLVSHGMRIERELNEQLLISRFMILAINKTDKVLCEKLVTPLAVFISELDAPQNGYISTLTPLSLLMGYEFLNESAKVIETAHILMKSAREEINSASQIISKLKAFIRFGNSEHKETFAEKVILESLGKTLQVVDKHSDDLFYELPFEYQGNTYTVKVTKEYTGELTGEIEDLPGFVTCGDDEQNLKANIQDLLGLYLTAA